MTPKQNLARAKQLDQLAQKEYEKADNHWLTAVTKYAQTKKTIRKTPKLHKQEKTTTSRTQKTADTM